MNSKRTFSIFIIVCIVLSACGCSLFAQSDNDAILSVAKEYSDAVIKANIDVIADDLYDGKLYKDNITALVKGNSDNELYEQICNAILNTMTYEIDEKSVVSSDSAGLVKVTFTLVNYNGALQSCISPGCTRNTYIDYLTADGPGTVSFDQEFKLVKNKGKWLINDDQCRQLFEVYGFYSDTLNNWYAYEHVYDGADIVVEMDYGLYANNGITEYDYLDTALTRFYERTGIRTTVCTLYKEDYVDKWPTLLDYAYDKYAELFGDDESRFLVVYSIPASQREAFITGSLDVPDFEFETISGDELTRIMDQQLCDKFVSNAHTMLMSGCGPGYAFGGAFNTLYNYLDPYSKNCPEYERLDY